MRVTRNCISTIVISFFSVIREDDRVQSKVKLDRGCNVAFVASASDVGLHTQPTARQLSPPECTAEQSNNVKP